MSIAASPSALQPEDYDEIEAAVMETARGRWFLAEYARRARAAETESLRLVLERIEMRLDALGAPPKVEAIPVVESLDALAWKLRERGVDDYVCGKIESLSREIAAGGVVVSAPRGAQPRDTTMDAPEPLSVDEARVRSPADEAPQPELADIHTARAVSLGQGADRLPEQSLEDDIASPRAINDEAPPPPAVDPRLDALLWLDRLPLLDRMTLFA